MDLYLIRHAIAEERMDGFPDTQRELTDMGRARFSRMVEDLARGKVRLDRVYTSPWTRAAQTRPLTSRRSLRGT